MLHWLCYLFLLILLFAGLVVNVFTLPGNWMMLGAVALYAWITENKHYIGWKSLTILLVLAMVGEIVETFAAGSAAKKFGGTRWGSIGALAGGLLGGIVLTPLIPIPVLGTLCGILIGTFLGAAVLEIAGGKQIHHSALIGVGATGGRLVGTSLKFAIGILIVLISLIVAIPWHG